MVQLVKVLSLALVLGLSALPVTGHAAKRPKPAPASVAADTSLQSRFVQRPDGKTSDRWQAEYDAQLAKEAADAAAAAAAAAAAKVAAAAQAAAAPKPRGSAYTPTPAVSSGAVQDLIRQAFGPQGQAAVDWGLRVAACESGYNPNAYNPGGPSGVFQFMPGTFRGTPYGNQNIFDAKANVYAAAWYYQKNGGGAWSCK
ncbi:MAG: lytic transglycosylase domain-containing protein [Candidatus Dormibacteraeota bacterium]|nr:lytic transglycosylase domain-containing protein [Candidatus Dormibacteraeota bacterium]